MPFDFNGFTLTFYFIFFPAGNAIYNIFEGFCKTFEVLPTLLLKHIVANLTAAYFHLEFEIWNIFFCKTILKCKIAWQIFFRFAIAAHLNTNVHYRALACDLQHTEVISKSKVLFTKMKMRSSRYLKNWLKIKCGMFCIGVSLSNNIEII